MEESIGAHLEASRRRNRSISPELQLRREEVEEAISAPLKVRSERGKTGIVPSIAKGIDRHFILVERWPEAKRRGKRRGCRARQEEEGEEERKEKERRF
ncbi:hypothetical protein JCGZ_14813 [Jatropha curcas]|uniref:Uncharacterized protein n=1 Tax=Jatropha curcas TaxID=180498 RepID=A0A067K988_JATCU|nr:hypothetical protein JCGZ_14813 [Jatropha curcas]